TAGTERFEPALGILPRLLVDLVLEVARAHGDPHLAPANRRAEAARRVRGQHTLRRDLALARADAFGAAPELHREVALEQMETRADERPPARARVAPRLRVAARPAQNERRAGEEQRAPLGMPFGAEQPEAVEVGIGERARPYRELLERRAVDDDARARTAGEIRETRVTLRCRPQIEVEHAGPRALEEWIHVEHEVDPLRVEHALDPRARVEAIALHLVAHGRRR